MRWRIEWDYLDSIYGGRNGGYNEVYANSAIEALSEDAVQGKVEQEMLKSEDIKIRIHRIQ